jgi:autotransporter-associated beta strand protein
VTLDQSGRGLLKFTSPFDISGFGHGKTLVLTGDGAGELAGTLADPYDRKKAAKTSVTKTGTGVWTLSGVNRFTGPTIVDQGTLALAGARSLGADTDVSVADGAMLDLAFDGELTVRKLILGGTVQPAGAYGATNTPGFIKGRGVLRVQR